MIDQLIFIPHINLLVTIGRDKFIYVYKMFGDHLIK